jgi:hypothetical protein
MPSSRSHELVAACEEKNVDCVEVDQNGTPMRQPGAEESSAQPAETLFGQ